MLQHPLTIKLDNLNLVKATAHENQCLVISMHKSHLPLIDESARHHGIAQGLHPILTLFPLRQVIDRMNIIGFPRLRQRKWR